MKIITGVTDAIPGVGAPAKCDTCGTALRIGPGTCVTCMMHEGLSTDSMPSEEQFEAVLAEANVPDQKWRLGNYDILGEIGRGGMGIIYRARQHRSRRIVAVKRVLMHHADSGDHVERFRREAEAAASLDHPNILPIYEVGESEGGPFFSMKWAAGGSLRDVGGALRDQPAECARLMAKVARAIAHAHGAGILHRDLQPGNILLDARAEPLVSDFGLAKWVDEHSDLTRTLTTFGTPGYIAPEQADGPAATVTAAADIYSLGAILFNLLTGRPPFTGSNALSVLRQAAEIPAPRLCSLAPEIDRDLETIVARCLEREPRARYASAAALAEDLERYLDGRPIIARRVSPPARAWRWTRRNPALAAAAAACVLLALALLGVISGELFRPERTASAAPDKSIAVLPFESVEDEERDAILAAGIQDELLTSLGKIADLKVISRSSVREFKPGVPRNLPQIATALGVRHILEGSVRHSDGRVRISAYLTDTLTGEQLWAETYDRNLPDIFLVRAEIAGQISNQLQAQLSEREQARLKTPPTSDMLAYELYLQARDIAEKAGLSTAERTAHQVQLLDRAIQRDPSFVPALCMLARVHILAYWTNYDHTPARYEAARQTLEAAARLQPDAGEVRLTRGIISYWGKREYGPALAELQLAAKSLPNNADIPMFVGLIKRRGGDWAGSTAALEQARTMDPRNDIILFELTRTNYFATKRYRLAAEACDSLLVRKPESFDFALTRAKVDLAARADLRRLQALLGGAAPAGAEPDLLVYERLELALLERNYTAARGLLGDNPLPHFNWAGYITPREWYQGVIAQGLGEHDAAQAAFEAANRLLDETIAARPDDAKAHIVQAEILARAGRKTEAIRVGERALQLRPIAKDAVDGVHIMGRLAGVYAQVGELRRALDLLETAAMQPNGTNFGSLMLETTWDFLREDPRFRKIVAALAPPAGEQ